MQIWSSYVIGRAYGCPLLLTSVFSAVSEDWGGGVGGLKRQDEKW